MNYRHIYHAGNFADVVKHLALVMAIEHLKKKDAPFSVVDAHGGIGLYDLASEQARKTYEWTGGIGRFKGRALPEDFKPYYDLAAPYLAGGHYPGSPLLAASMLRPQDRLIANELHPDDVETLRDTLYGFDNARVTHLDAYECLRANLPPKEKRGLVLIDPPFEKKDEFETLIRQMAAWKKRFANGVYILWYPIKTHLPVEALKEAARALGLPRTWCLEAFLHPKETEGVFAGSGLIVFNAPYLLPERLAALGAFLTEAMGLHAVTAEWLVEERPR